MRSMESEAVSEIYIGSCQTSLENQGSRQSCSVHEGSAASLGAAVGNQAQAKHHLQNTLIRVW